MNATNRYSQHARRAIDHARALAKAEGQGHLDCSHLLIGILHENNSLGCNILHDLDMDLPRTENAFRQILPIQSSPQQSNANSAYNGPIMTLALREAFTLAADESRWLGQHYVGTEHLLLGIARGGEESLSALLRVLDVNPEQIRRRVRRQLQEGITEISLEQAKRVARLSELSRRVLNGAEQISQQLGHKRVGLAHLLLVMGFERRSVCARMLLENGLDIALLEANLTKPRPATGGMLEDVIDRAVDRAESFGSHYTGTDHLLLTLALDSRGARLLRKYGVDPQKIVQQMSAHLSR